jgi:hypothetical protein
MSPTPTRRPTRRVLLLALVGVVAAGSLLAAGAVATDTLGAGHLYQRAVAKVDRFLAGPVPDRSIAPTVEVTEPPDTPVPTPTATPTPVATTRPTSGGSSGVASPTPVATPTPEPTPSPTPVRKKVDVKLAGDPAAIFAHEKNDTWCAAAGVQIILTYFGKGNTSNRFQAELMGRVHEWESYRDSHNGDWGPSAMSLALADYGVPGYEVRAYKTRGAALLDAARAIQQMHAPVILLAWRGAHTWVMNGFRADADPSVFSDAKVTGAYILDPWYPDVSSIWGPSDPPGAFQNASEMVRNYLAWKRPEGHYPDRDGKFIAVVPTRPFTSGG